MKSEDYKVLRLDMELENYSRQQQIQLRKLSLTTMKDASQRRIASLE